MAAILPTHCQEIGPEDHFCPISQQPMVKVLTLEGCWHSMDENTFAQWNRDCPLCRGPAVPFPLDVPVERLEVLAQDQKKIQSACDAYHEAHAGDLSLALAEVVVQTNRNCVATVRAITFENQSKVETYYVENNLVIHPVTDLYPIDPRDLLIRFSKREKSMKDRMKTFVPIAVLGLATALAIRYRLKRPQ